MFKPSWWNWPYTESSHIRPARKYEPCHILKAFSPKKGKTNATFHWSRWSSKGVVADFFCSNCKEIDVTFSQLHLQRLMHSKWAGSTAPELNLASAITVSFYMCMTNKTKGIIICILSLQNKSHHKTTHKVQCMGGRDHLSGIERKTMPRARTSLFPPSLSLKMQ